MRSELQYNLQRARALVTELRCTLEIILEFETDELPDDAVTYCSVDDLESMLDDHPNAGEGSVRLTIEPFEGES